ncbi:MAG: tRNA-dihydrouridine synthase [Rickettsiales bacterium]|jgi:dihydroorotate dehydrogenase|nr:tRNA-dihydrouridine synthase [Rickettsiales bacterium]
MTSLYNTEISYADNRKEFPKAQKPYILTQAQARAQVGVAAGPLLDYNFIKYAVDMGAGIVVYKTVRSRGWQCLPHPNCIFVDKDSEIIPGGTAFASYSNESWTMTNSFGMPSDSPEVWMDDVAVSQKYADKFGRRMIVSVVGSPDQNAASLSADQAKKALALDYARAAKMAVKAGAKEIELNLSCPNVKPELGILYADADFVAGIVEAVRNEIGWDIPVFIKVGWYAKKENALESDINNMALVAQEAMIAGADGIVGINTISMNVVNSDGTPALPGRTKADGSPNAVSGVCGRNIEPFADKWLEDMVRVREHLGGIGKLQIGSCGGVVHGSQFTGRLAKGADMAFTASGAIMNPLIFAQYHGLAK